VGEQRLTTGHGRQPELGVEVSLLLELHQQPPSLADEGPEGGQRVRNAKLIAQHLDEPT
jgi:hypothetical protein